MSKCKIIPLIVSLTLLFSCCSCESEDYIHPEDFEDGVQPLNTAHKEDEIEVYVDKETGVNYLMFRTKDSYGMSGGGITVRINADGTPYVSEESGR